MCKGELSATAATGLSERNRDETEVCNGGRACAAPADLRHKKHFDRAFSIRLANFTISTFACFPSVGIAKGSSQPFLSDIYLWWNVMKIPLNWISDHCSALTDCLLQSHSHCRLKLDGECPLVGMEAVKEWIKHEALFLSPLSPLLKQIFSSGWQISRVIQLHLFLSTMTPPTVTVSALGCC